MPISEDEYEHLHSPSNMQSGMSKAEQRRSNKPIMEKKRRARINHCLNELKSLILDAMKKDPARHSKLEKADILEMTVKHLQNVQRQQLAVAVATDPTVLHKFKSGFNECATEVGRCIGNMDGVENGVKQRLVAHLSNCVTGLQQITPFTFPGINTGSYTNNSNQGNTQQESGSSNAGNSFGDVNNNQNNRIQVPVGLQLIPSRLPTGELALLVPNSSNLPFFSPSVINAVQPLLNNDNATKSTERTFQSAFTTVRSAAKDYKYKTPPLSPASSTTSYEDALPTEAYNYPIPVSPKYATLPKTPQTVINPVPISKDETKPAQQFHITSTSLSPENVPEPSLKIEYKTVPIYQPTDRYRELSFESTPSKSFQSLSVITSAKSSDSDVDCSLRETSGDRSQDSFLKRKRPYYDSPEGLLTIAVERSEPENKYARYSSESVSTTNSSSGSPDQWSKVNQQTHKPSTSASNNDEMRDSHDSMWRPW